MGQWRIVDRDIPSVTVGMEIVGGSPDRVNVFICNLDTVVLQVTTNPPSVNPQYGIPIEPNDFLEIPYSRSGELAQSSIRAAQCSGSGIAHITEVLYYRTENKNGSGRVS